MSAPGFNQTYCGSFVDTFTLEEHNYAPPRVYAYDLVVQWLNAVAANRQPSALIVSKLMLRSYMLHSTNDLRFEYVPRVAFAHGDFGGEVVLKNQGRVMDVLLRFKNAKEVKAFAPMLAQRIVQAMKQPGVKSVGVSTRSPLNHFSDHTVQKVYYMRNLVF